jgi:outer membrane protein insertion porin family
MQFNMQCQIKDKLKTGERTQPSSAFTWVKRLGLACVLSSVALPVFGQNTGPGYGYQGTALNMPQAPFQQYPNELPPPNYQQPSVYSQQPAMNQPAMNQPNGGFGQPATTYQNPPYGQAPYGQAPVGLAPAINQQAPLIPGPRNEPLPPLNVPWQIEPSTTFNQSSPFGYNPKVRDVPVDVFVQEGQTGRFSFGGSVNSDLGVSGQVILEERNFDIRRWPSRPRDLLNGAFRGDGQNFRLEIVPGNQVQRYTLNFTEPNLFGYSPFSLSVGGFYFTRIYRDWTEKRIGARASIGYEITPDLSISTELRGEDVGISRPRVNGVPALDRALGSNDLYTGRVRLAHNTRDSPFLPTEGHLLELIYDQVFGEFDFPRGQVNLSRYFLIRERADNSGRHTLTSSWRAGFAGVDQPIFENFFAGGFSTMRGFQFRGASPVDGGVQVGGRFQFIGSVEYMFPITADDMLRMVAFVDYGTVERDIKFDSKNFRVAPGIGARIAVPALGPAPLAFDFAFPVAYADSDTRQVFSFTMGLVR